MSAKDRPNLTSTGGTEGITTFEMIQILAKLLPSSFKPSIFLWGPTGIGKSTLVRQVLCDMENNRAKTAAEQQGLPIPQELRLSDIELSGVYSYERYGQFGLIDLRVSLLDPSDIRGLPYPEKNLTIWFPPSELPLVGQESRFPEKGILLLDELTHAAPAIQSACYSLVLDRKVGPHKILPGWKIIAASNLSSERAHTFDLPHPLKNRFVHYLLRADLEAYKKWGYAAGLDPRILSFLNWYPTYLHLDNDETQNAFPTPRSWSYVSEMLAAFENGDRLRNVEACIGKGTAAIFHAYLEMYDAEMKSGVLQELDAVLKGRKKPTPFKADQTGLAYAVSARIAGLMLTDAKTWMPLCLPYLLGPTWENLREIARATTSDMSVINCKVFAEALSLNDGELNKLYYKVFKGMTGTGK